MLDLSKGRGDTLKFFHTADWHLGKLVQGMSMTEDQSFILDQFIQVVKEEKPDAIVIAGDLYDRAVPPPEAVQLLNRVIEILILDLKTPVLAIAGNHDSPSRLHFTSNILQNNGLYLIGQLTDHLSPVKLTDEYGEVHFHLVPYCDPSVVRNMFQDETIRTHQDAMRKLTNSIKANMNPSARHVFVGHAFVTPYGEENENTSESERTLSIGGAEYVSAECFTEFHYTALGHLHRAHYVLKEPIRYAGSPLKYSISEETHHKGFYIVHLDADGFVDIEKKELIPKRDLRTVKGTMEEILQFPVSDDYIFVQLLDKTPVLSPMEKIRSVFPNAMHVERKNISFPSTFVGTSSSLKRKDKSDLELFQAFYKEVKGVKPTEDMNEILKDVLDEMLQDIDTDIKELESIN